jgi:hypothetical protein
MKTMTDLVGGVDESELREELGQSFDQFKRPEELYYAFQAAVTACHEASEDMLGDTPKDEDFRKFVFGYQVEMIIHAFNKRIAEIAQ